MGYLDSSSLEEATQDLVPPTVEEFMEKAGEPILSFDLSTPHLEIPKGILDCCRVAHQPHCKHHVAGTLLGCFYTLRMPDGSIRERVPQRQSFDGDALFSYDRLATVIQITWQMVQATAEQLEADVLGVHFDVWTFNLADWEAWRYIQQQIEKRTEATLASLDLSTPEQIAALDIVTLTPAQCRPDRLAKRMAKPNWHPVAAYADRVEVMPTEIGHDDKARYITDFVWGQPNVVPPAVDALREVPETEETPCQPVTATT